MKRIISFLSIIVSIAPSHAAEAARPLRLDEARQFALATHPRISAEQLRALATRQTVIQARSAYFPNITGNVTAVGTGEDNARIAAGSLSNPGIFQRNAEGIVISQLVTDFGRTANLTSSAKLRAGAGEASVENVKEQILLLTDTAFFEALRAGAVLEVAHQTLQARQDLLDQVTALASNKLKSELDLNFARVSVDEARILNLQADGEQSAAFARLAMLTGLDGNTRFDLQDVNAPIETLPDESELTREALLRRPELHQLDLEAQSARKLIKAEKASGYPTISILGAAGVIPFHDSHFADEYGVAGINMSVPIFAGGLYSARAKEARYRAEAAEQLLKARQEEVARDVRVAALVVKTAGERIAVARHLMDHANQAYSLAETKYSLGGASIVELSQAQLSRTLAAIEAATARYNYQIQLSNLKFQAGLLGPQSLK